MRRAGDKIGNVHGNTKGGLMLITNKILSVGAACLGGVIAFSSAPAKAWEPTHPIEIIVPAGTGGGADQNVAHDARHHHQACVDEAAGGGHQQVRRPPAAKAFSTSRTPRVTITS